MKALRADMFVAEAERFLKMIGKTVCRTYDGLRKKLKKRLKLKKKNSIFRFKMPFFTREEICETRRPKLCRRRTGYYKIRVREVGRYRSGVEAASLFELSERQRSWDEPAETSKRARRMSKRSRGLIVAAAVLLIVSGAVFGGVRYLNSLYHNETLFISDEEQAGNVTITQRLTTSNEMAEKVSYFLLVGVDKSSLLTDCIWLACYDLEKSEMHVMQIPRDTYVGNESASGKINAVYSNPKTVTFCEKCGYSPDKSERDDGYHTVCGTKLSKVKESNISALIRAINEHFGMPVDHFVIFDFAGFAKIVNTMGGIDVHLEYRVHDSAIDLAPGDHHLGGWQAVDFMRSRKGFKEGDIGRVKNQRIMIEALMNKALNMELSQMLGLITNCSDCFQTDLSPAEITSYATSARSLDVSKLEMFTMPGYDHWVKPNPSYFLCSEKQTAEMINEKLLPYGLPGGGLASDDTVNFPSVYDKLPAQSDDDDRASTTAQTTASTVRTTGQTTGETPTSGTPKTKPTTETPTNPPTEAPTDPPTKPPTEAPTNPPTEAPTNPPTEAPTNPPTNPPTEAPPKPTNPPTEAPPEEPFPTKIDEVIYAARYGSGSTKTPLSDPRG